MIDNTRSATTPRDAEHPFVIFPDEASRFLKNYWESESSYDASQTTRFKHQEHQGLARAATNLALSFGEVLRSVMEHTGALQSQLGNTDMDRRHLQAIRHQCMRGANLAHRLMLFSGKIPVKMASLDLNDAVIGIGPMICGTIRRGVNIELDVADEKLLIMGDEAMLLEVLACLVENANDAVHSNGSIAVATRKIERTYASSDIKGGAFTGECAMLSVADSGPGIDATIRGQIFEPFFTTKRPGKGLGLGLAIVEHIVHIHNGCLSMATRKGEGTMVRIYFPFSSSFTRVGVKESAS